MSSSSVPSLLSPPIRKEQRGKTNRLAGDYSLSLSLCVCVCVSVKEGWRE